MPEILENRKLFNMPAFEESNPDPNYYTDQGMPAVTQKIHPVCK
jgi:hypothetical protein